MNENEDVIIGQECRSTFYSLDELAEAATRRVELDSAASYITQRDSSWCGGSWQDNLTHLREGWTEELDSAIEISESALTQVEKIAEMPAFLPVYDVAGCDVDIARYLAGEPENMIEYPATMISRAGKVVTICANNGVAGGIAAEKFIRRGHAIVALIMALQEMGHSTELWVECAHGGSSGLIVSWRCMVKGANDVIDPARIMFAFANPGMVRTIGFAITHGAPSSHKRACGIGAAYGSVVELAKDLPEGTLYLPKTTLDIANPEEFVLAYLRELGLIEEG